VLAAVAVELLGRLALVLLGHHITPGRLGSGRRDTRYAYLKGWGSRPTRRRPARVIRGRYWGRCLAEATLVRSASLGGTGPLWDCIGDEPATTFIS